MNDSSPVINLEDISVVFGNMPQKALPLMDNGDTREKIKSETGQILGVHDCSLTVAAGEIVVLMGLSGSGKSTLLRVVNRLNQPCRGRVWVDNGQELTDITNADDATLCFFRTRRIAMVFQQFGLLPWRSVIDNIAFGLEIAGVTPAERRQKAMQQLEMVNLSGWEDRHVQELSGGMQQRVGLARAFATESPILLMDEPFSALDPLIRVHLQDELLDLQARLQRTILFVSHDLDEALRIGNRIIIMEGGRIIQTGTPEEIVLQPANNYVAEFVANMNPLKTLRARTVMHPLSQLADKSSIDDAANTVNISDNEKLLEVLRLNQDSDKTLIVRDENNEAVGYINRDAIYTALLR